MAQPNGMGPSSYHYKESYSEKDLKQLKTNQSMRLVHQLIPVKFCREDITNIIICGK